MMYEAQIAGIGDAVPGAGPMNAMMRRIQPRFMTELRERRGRITAGLHGVADLEFVNGGGTGSLEATRADPVVTEMTAGSGLFAGRLFDGYRAFTPAPAAAYAFDVVRRPAPQIATVLGGGWIASGPPGPGRSPQPVWPQGLRLLPREGAGEVQTPLRGAGAAALRAGDRVWFRHAKSGEPAEHVTRYHVVKPGASSPNCLLTAARERRSCEHLRRKDCPPVAELGPQRIGRSPADGAAGQRRRPAAVGRRGRSRG
ncbi:hypothetical protein [Arthrobacter sp. zg-Y1143]|uniref:hypothetical protein n=1 Tax=Arthrobacter sp. zg-Y1143 TaxID=3049065 RepID=UPI0032E4CFCE